MNVHQIIHEAKLAGEIAARNFKPTPMVVGQAVGLFGNQIVPGTEEVVPEGVCGFAWVNIYRKSSETNRQFIKELKEAGMVDENKDSRSHNPNHIFTKISYMGPVHYNFWCPLMTQGMGRKEAYCNAFAEVLRKYGISVSVGSRMD